MIWGESETVMKKYNVTVNGTVYEVLVEEVSGAAATSIPTPAPAPISTPAPTPAPAVSAAPAPKAPTAPAAPAAAGSINVTSPMPGTILNINVSAGQSVKKGETLCVLEAMKMENDIPAPQDGVVASVNVSKGASVQAGDLLISLK